jgi:hypothetical protein
MIIDCQALIVGVENSPQAVAETHGKRRIPLP